MVTLSSLLVVFYWLLNSEKGKEDKTFRRQVNSIGTKLSKYESFVDENFQKLIFSVVELHQPVEKSLLPQMPPEILEMLSTKQNSLSSPSAPASSSSSRIGSKRLRRNSKRLRRNSSASAAASAASSSAAAASAAVSSSSSSSATNIDGDELLFTLGNVRFRTIDRKVLAEDKCLTSGVVEMIMNHINSDYHEDNLEGKTHTFGIHFDGYLRGDDKFRREGILKCALRVENGIFTKDFLHIAHNPGYHWILISVVRPSLVSGFWFLQFPQPLKFTMKVAMPPNDSTEEQDRPCILVMDSYNSEGDNAHAAAIVRLLHRCKALHIQVY